MKLVVRLVPFHNTVAPETKLLPFTLSVKAPLPAVTLEGESELSTGAAVGVTLIGPDVPVIAATTMSVAVIVLFPTLLSLAENTPVPLVRVESGGRIADPSLLVNFTVPA